MHGKAHFCDSIFVMSWSPANTGLAVPLTLLFLLFVALSLTITAQPAQGQTFTVLHSFTNRLDGGDPDAGLTMDAAGHLYGTTLNGGSRDSGAVFELRYSGSNWAFTPLYGFAGGDDGASAWGRVAVAHDGSLYGTTHAQGIGPCGWGGCGTVFQLRSRPTVAPSPLSPWNESVIYRFTGGNDGGWPQGDLVFDPFGNLYGSTVIGGTGNWGVVYELTPSGDGWAENVLYSFQGGGDGGEPYGGVVFGRSGNLYGVTYGGGSYGYGTVYQLTSSTNGWTKETLHSFRYNVDGAWLFGGLLVDSAGNLYGTTSDGGPSGGGTVFELKPSHGTWIFETLYSFSGRHAGPYDKLVMDAAGNLYGTTYGDGEYGLGAVFKLTPSSDGWIYTSLHDFTGGSDGALPASTITFDSSGNLYGTTGIDGSGYCGTVWQITP